LALTRAAAALGAVNVGYQVPDYTAYEDMLGYHLSRLHAIPLRTSPEDGFRLAPARFRRFAEEQGLGAFLFSNPCYPTGAVQARNSASSCATASRPT
jgi:aspartate/methionine/tyrosine aminotransferase